MAKKRRKPKPVEELPSEIVSKVMAAMGKKGGSKKGKSKARTSEQARAAVNARWAKAKVEQVDTAADGECPPPQT
jgi:hypothetical protein